jgi:hypothetical protein
MWIAIAAWTLVRKNFRARVRVVTSTGEEKGGKGVKVMAWEADK